MCSCRVIIMFFLLGNMIFSIFLILVYRCLTMLLKQKKWLKSMSHLPLTFWSGLNKPLLSWTIANLPILWLGFNNSFRHLTLTALWRSHPSKMQIGMSYLQNGKRENCSVGSCFLTYVISSLNECLSPVACLTPLHLTLSGWALLQATSSVSPSQ